VITETDVPAVTSRVVDDVTVTRRDDDAGGTWPAHEEWNRWQHALAEVALRVQEERGVEESWRMTVDRGALWAEYGDLRVCVAGHGAELAGGS
jgi:hypothetical protein